MTLVLGALAAELLDLRAHLAGCREERQGGLFPAAGTLGANEVVVVCSGVGKTMAALATQRAIDRYSPNRIIYTGIAGALKLDLAVGDVVVGRESLQYDLDARAAGFEIGRVPFSEYRFVPSDPQLVEAALSFHAEDFRIRAGRILTGDRVVSRPSPDTMKLLVGDLGGDAVDMEGASAGLVALVNRTPFLLLRVISDRVAEGVDVNLKTFLPLAAQRSFLVVNHVLERTTDSYGRTP